jgi:hypothetical protein
MAMPLKAIRPRHVYLASAAAFVALAGFEGARMAAGHDPALAASRQVRPAQPYSGGDAQGGFADPDDGFVDPNDAQGGGSDPSQVPQPESRLS